MIDIDAMTGQGFEEYFAEILSQRGYCIERRNGGRGDGGADILATSPDGTRWAVQCKRHTANVSRPVIRELLGTVASEHYGRKPWLVTTAFLTEPAWELAIDNEVQVTDRTSLLELIAETEDAEAVRTPAGRKFVSEYPIPRLIKALAAFAVAGGCVAFFLKASPSQPRLPGKGCPAGYVCMYTVDGLINSTPEHKYYSYGCYNLYNEFGTRYILNSQTSGAEALLYKGYGCSGLAITIPHLDTWHGSVSPIYSILVTP